MRISSWYSKRSFRYHAVHVADTVLSRCIVAWQISLTVDLTWVWLIGEKVEWGKDAISYLDISRTEVTLINTWTISSV